MSFKEKLKKVPILYPLAMHLKEGLKCTKDIPSFLAERRIDRGAGPVRVGFLCQYIPSWVKLQPIYDMMRADSRFEPFLLCVPSGIEDGVLQSDDYSVNDTLDYFHSHGYPEAINTLQADGSWLDLKAMNLSYIFYPRPYNAYMPACYQSGQVCRHSKICLVLYGMNVTQEVVRVTLNRNFFRHVYCYFAELPYPRQQNQRNGWLLHVLGLQKSVYYGIPGVESIRAAEKLERPAWNFAKEGLRVMWTPRWTTDLSLGGSNFFTYYEFLLDLAEKDPGYAFLFRPHPLAISHFLETGELTQAQADAFLERCEKLPNVSLDQEKSYSATFWGADVLLTDISGIIPEYFATGKPMIFCASNMHLTLEKTTVKMIEASYVVNNVAELEACLNNLKQGIDPLAKKREQVLQKYFGEENSRPTRKIVEQLAARK